MNEIISLAADIMNKSGCNYAVCGGLALELFLGRKTRGHGDIDICVFWNERDKTILYMQSQGWDIYEMLGGGMCHKITDINRQKKLKRNVFCVREECGVLRFDPAEGEDEDVFFVDINETDNPDRNFIELLYNDESAESFIYARNDKIRRELKKAILTRGGIPYLAPELVLLYKSTDTARQANRADFETVYPYMDDEQKEWLNNALKTAYPDGHEWIRDF